MKLIRTTTLLTCCIALSPVLAQERSAQQLHLKTGVYDCPNNLEAFIDLPYRADELRKGAYYRIIQFNELPTPKEQREMVEAGIELRSYVPSYAFQARIRSDASLNKLSHWGARSVMEIDPRFKMTQPLANRDFPAHALESDDHILLSVLYYPDFTAEEVIASLDQINARILGQFAERNQIELSVPINRWEEIAAMPEIFFIEAIDPTPEPENDRGRTNHRVNFYQNGSTQYGGFDGSGIVVAMGDDGRIGPHIDYRGRVDQRYASGSSGNHGDHVAGTILGAGNYDPDGRGNAPGAYLFTYQPFINVNNSSSHYYSHQVRITSTSYSLGCNTGYTSYASFADQTIYDHPGLMHVFSAGNQGIWTDCNYGAGPGWGNVTGGIKVGKNTIAVGSVRYNDVLSNFSSRGPAEDGRIKPDVCAVGASVYSTVEGNSYATFSGTSMSCPGVAGVLATMYHAYKETNNGSEPTSDLMKGILMNTAEDLGNPGPDFRYGYGRVNARRAHKAITDQTFFRDSVAQGESDIFYLTVPAGIGELKVMLYWNDVEGTPAAQNPLVNNLQLVVTDPNNVDYNPWVLDHTPIVANLNAPAVRAVDSLNNAEQVTLDDPAAGSYTLAVSGATVPNGPQRYVLVYQYTPEDEIVLTFPNGGAALLPNSTEVVRWDALSNGTGFTLDYSDDNGTTWNTIGTAGANQRYKDWSVPGLLASDEVLVRVSRGSDSDQSDSTNTALRRVENFQAQLICPDFIFFTWDPVPGAASYEIMHLDTAYMQVAGTVTDTFGTVLHHTSADHYYTIRAVGANGGKGERRVALFISADTQNCVLDHDIGLTLLSPFHGPNPGCGNTGQVEVAVRATNFGNNDVFGLSLTYGHDANTTVTEAFTDTLLAGESKELVFGQTITSGGSSTNTLVVYRSDTLDQNLYNDTAKASFYFLSPDTVIMSPWADNLESFTACSTTSDCEATVCSLPGGWVNLPNGASDDIDWRANSGGTPSSGTGPDQDHDPGNSTGMYLYLEASTECHFQEAVLYSPCLIVPPSGPIGLAYRYHMKGVHQGELHTDLVVNGRLFEDVIPVVAGNQGSAWNLASVDLNAYSGDTVVVRLRGVTGPGARSDLALDDFVIGTPLTISLDSATQVSCFGSNDGALAVTVSGGVPPYSYSWNNGHTTPSLSNLTAGQYQLIVTGSDGFPVAAMFTITEPDLLTVSTSSAIETICFYGSNDTLFLTVSGGIPPYSYLWNTGHTTSTLTNLTARQYAATVTDANGCQQSITTLVNGISVTVEIRTDYWPKETTWEIVDSLGNILHSGGPYSNSAKKYQETFCLDPSCFDFIIYDSYGDGICCLYGNGYVNLLDSAGLAIASHNGQFSNQATLPFCLISCPFSVNATPTDPGCHNTSDGSITLMPSDGIPPYSYLWNTGHTTSALTNLTAGQYQATVTDDGGCQMTERFTLTDPDLLTVLPDSATRTICFNGNNDALALTVSGGTPPYSYLWNTGHTTSTLTNLTGGQYQATVTDNNNCQGIAMYTILEEMSVTVEIQTDDYPQETTWKIVNSLGNILYSGGPYSNPRNNYQETFCPDPGCFDFIIDDSYGDGICCYYGSGYVNLLDSAGLVIASHNGQFGNQATVSFCLADCPFSVNATLTDPACHNASDGSIMLMPSDGMPPYSYLWETGHTTSNPTNLTAGQYQLTVTDDNGCQVIERFTLTDPDLLTVLPDSAIRTICFNGNNDTLALTVSGGAPPYSYLWNTGDATSTLTNLTGGQYQATVTDNNNCQGIAMYTILEEVSVTVEIQTDDYPEETTWKIVDSLGNILYSGGPYFNHRNNYQETFCPDPGCFDFIIDDSYGDGICCDYGSGYVNLLDSAGLVIASHNGQFGNQATVSFCLTDCPLFVNATPTDPTCHSASDGSITLTLSDGMPPYSYLWNTGQTTSTPTNLAAGQYQLTVTDDNGCQAIERFTLTDPNLLTVSFAATHVSSFGGNDGALAVTVSGGTHPYSYWWTTGHTTSQLTNLTAGPYQVTVTDANSCQQVFSYTINELSDPIAPDNSSQDGGTTNNTETDESLPYSSNVWEMDFPQSMPTVTGLPNDTYTVTDASEYADSAQVMVADMEGSDFVRRIDVYPNPATSEVFIDYNFTGEVDLEVTVTSNLGQIVLKTREPNAVNGQLRLDVARWADGVYYMLLSNGNQSDSRKLIIRK